MRVNIKMSKRLWTQKQIKTDESGNCFWDEASNIRLEPNVLGMAASQSLSKQVLRGRHYGSCQDEKAAGSGRPQGQRGEMRQIAMSKATENGVFWWQPRSLSGVELQRSWSGGPEGASLTSIPMNSAGTVPRRVSHPASPVTLK